MPPPAGRAAILEHLNPNTVRPSVNLLEQVLALRGALPSGNLANCENWHEESPSDWPSNWRIGFGRPCPG